MTYTIQTINSISNSELDSIATLEDTNLKSVIISSFNMSDIKFKIQKDGLNIVFLAGTNANNEFSVTGPALFSDDSQSNTSYMYDSEFWSTLKGYVIDNNCTAFVVNTIKNSDMYNSLVNVGSNSLYSNSTLEQNDITFGDTTSTSIKFVHD